MSPIGHGGVTDRDRVVSPTGHGGIIQGHRDVTRRDVEVSRVGCGAVSPEGTDITRWHRGVTHKYHLWGVEVSPIGCGDVTWTQRCYVTHRDRGGSHVVWGSVNPGDGDWHRGVTRGARRHHLWDVAVSPLGTEMSPSRTWHGDVTRGTKPTRGDMEMPTWEMWATHGGTCHPWGTGMSPMGSVQPHCGHRGSTLSTGWGGGGTGHTGRH